MYKHIMLSFLSPFKTDEDSHELIVSKYHDKDTFSCDGVQTNEPGIKYTLSNVKTLDKAFIFASNAVNKKFSYKDSKTGKLISKKHLQLFEERMSLSAPLLENNFVVVNYHEDNKYEKSEDAKNEADASDLSQSDTKSVVEMYDKVLSFAEKCMAEGNTVVLHVDMTGGFRHASLLMLAVVQLLKYSGVIVKEVLYTNYNAGQKTGCVDDVTNIYDLFQLIAGMESFTKYGKTEVLETYLKKSEENLSDKLTVLLKAMKQFADDLQLCRSGALRSAAHNLKSAIDNYKLYKPGNMQERLFQKLLRVFEREYSDILNEKRHSLDIIKWCLNKNFLQQALTFYTEWIPEYIVDQKIFYPGNSQVIESCQEKTVEYTPWQKYFLLNFKPDEMSAYDDCNMLKIFRETMKRKGQDDNSMIDPRLLQNKKVMQIFNEINKFPSLKNRIHITKGNAIQECELPVLSNVLNIIYENNKKGITYRSSFTEFLNNINKTKIYNSLSGMPEQQLYETFAFTSTIIKDKKKVSIEKKQDNRKKELIKLIENKDAASNCGENAWLEILNDYMRVRDLRNTINHAGQNIDVPDCDHVKNLIIAMLIKLQNC
ncbi:MAG: TM1812 family CRISPR-associated protein [Acidaminococcaceae bacterium]|nr:TM1812 family CRISPR-associated protein [Acidaminococcaceae bacterium]